jgi:F-type H+-transporting ATPase subunit alpha
VVGELSCRAWRHGRPQVCNGGNPRDGDATCKQPEFDPVSVPAQIAILLALSAKLFDPVPLDQMSDAEQAVREAAADIPAEVSAGFETAAALRAEDRKTIIEIARRALAPFYPKPEAKPEADAAPKPKAKGNANAEPKADAAPKPEVKAGPKLEPESKPKVSTETKPAPVEKP